MPATISKHGTRSIYNDQGCRCGECRAANAEYRREQRARIRGWAGRYRPAQLRDMTEAEAAYVGAMIDGEGTVYFHPNGGIKVQFVNTNVEYVSAFLRATGVGRVHCRRGDERKLDLFIWQINAHNDVVALAERCSMYSTKLQRVLALLKEE